jgi:hypothetical protein
MTGTEDHQAADPEGQIQLREQSRQPLLGLHRDRFGGIESEMWPVVRIRLGSAATWQSSIGEPVPLNAESVLRRRVEDQLDRLSHRWTSGFRAAAG